MENLLKGSLGFKGERGYSAYEIAVQNGYEGSEQDWLATLGTSEHLIRTVTKIDVTAIQSTFTVSDLTSSSLVDVYVNGVRKTEDSYTVDVTAKTITFISPLEVNDVLEVYVSRMRTFEMPIVTTINDNSTDETVPSTKTVNTMKKGLESKISALNDVVLDEKISYDSFHILTGSKMNIASGETVIVDLPYPYGFSQSNTVVISKMVSSNNNYYEPISSEMTANGYPVITNVALTDSLIRVWLKNTNSTEAKNGYIKIALFRTHN